MEELTLLCHYALNFRFTRIYTVQWFRDPMPSKDLPTGNSLWTNPWLAASLSYKREPVRDREPACDWCTG